MSSLQENLQFSVRLKSALTKANYPISPTYLCNEFNNRYHGQPISVQSANNWILGKAIPNQDKLMILAIWLDVPMQWLRFGEDTPQPKQNSVNPSKSHNNITSEYFEKFLLLSPKKQEIVKLLIDELSQS